MSIILLVSSLKRKTLFMDRGREKSVLDEGIHDVKHQQDDLVERLNLRIFH
jgi:hypothetical protein